MADVQNGVVLSVAEVVAVRHGNVATFSEAPQQALQVRTGNGGVFATWQGAHMPMTPWGESGGAIMMETSLETDGV